MYFDVSTYNLVCKCSFVTWLAVSESEIAAVVMVTVVDYGSSDYQHSQSTSTTKRIRKRNVYLGVDSVKPCMET